MARMKSTRPKAPAVCPVCGEDVPRGAVACPECGADHKSGWREDADAYDAVNLPDEDFNYDKFVREEFGSDSETSWGKNRSGGLLVSFSSFFLRSFISMRSIRDELYARGCLWRACCGITFSEQKRPTPNAQHPTSNANKESAPERIRTTNLLIRSQMLYPVELRAPVREGVNLRRRQRASTQTHSVH